MTSEYSRRMRMRMRMRVRRRKGGEADETEQESLWSLCLSTKSSPRCKLDGKDPNITTAKISRVFVCQCATEEVDTRQCTKLLLRKVDWPVVSWGLLGTLPGAVSITRRSCRNEKPSGQVRAFSRQTMCTLSKARSDLNGTQRYLDRMKSSGHQEVRALRHKPPPR